MWTRNQGKLALVLLLHSPLHERSVLGERENLVCKGTQPVEGNKPPTNAPRERAGIWVSANALNNCQSIREAIGIEKEWAILLVSYGIVFFLHFLPPPTPKGKDAEEGGDLGETAAAIRLAWAGVGVKGRTVTRMCHGGWKTELRAFQHPQRDAKPPNLAEIESEPLCQGRRFDTPWQLEKVEVYASTPACPPIMWS